MKRIMRDLVAHSIGGGWGKAEPFPQGVQVAVIRGTDFPNCAIGDSDELPQRWETERRVASRRLVPGDIILESSGGSPDQSTGRTLFITHDLLESIELPAIPASFCKLMRIERDLANPRYVYYWLQNMYREGRTWGYQTASTGIANFQFEYFLDTELLVLPSLEEQTSIGTALGLLDDKIESNHRIRNHILDLCRLKFSMLFGDLGDETPGQQIITLDKIGRIVAGGTPSKKNPDYYSPNAIAWLTPRDLSRSRNVFRQHGELDISEEGLRKSSAQLLPEGTVLFTSRAPIGYLAIASGQTSTNQGFKSIVPNGEFGTPFTYFLLESLTPKIQAHAGGSTFKEISKTGMSAIRLTEPDLQDVSTFNNYSGPLLERLASCERESAKLSALRDVLLPELMSGRIRVRDIKHSVEDAVNHEIPEAKDV
jgi:type I restriction enzyme S subunit